MIRLLLVLAPAMCIVGGIGVSYSIRIFTRSLKQSISYMMTRYNSIEENVNRDKKAGKTKRKFSIGLLPSSVGIIFFTFLCSGFVFHSTYAGAVRYSSPSVVETN